MLNAEPINRCWMVWAAVLGLAFAGFAPLTMGAEVAVHKVARFDIVVADDTDENVPPAPAKPLAIEFGNPRPSTWESAHLLADYLHQATGAKFVVRKESAPSVQAGAIYVGPTTFTGEHFATDERAADLDAEGFVHHIIDDQHIVILGGSELGTEFGIYDFLERYVGVRWLMPTEAGEHIPKHDTLAIAEDFFRDEPKILSRMIRPHRVEGAMTWARRLRTSLRVEFHHNIPKLYPARLTKEHPELYPLIDGERYLPPKVNIPTWHPCYTAEGSVEITAGLIKDFFEKHPQYNSIAIGISDANEDRNCHCATCVAKYPGTTNTLGFAERSNIYYEWCNAVIANVHEQYPGKMFGTIAYRGVTDPPVGFKLDDHLVPFICFDRLLWADSSREAQDRQMTEAWESAAAELGWYDYIYGETYVVPRIYSHTLKRALQYAYDHNVRHYYAEANPSKDWHEGPKFYIAMKLLWNPDADVDALLHEWCEAAVGESAAPSLVSYFKFMEDFWTNRVPDTAWFSDRSKIYLIFNTTGYLDALTQEDVEQCSTWLKEVERKARTNKQKQRAKQLRDSFESRREETIDYFMLNNAIPAEPELTRDVKLIEKLDFNDKPSGWAPYSSENKGDWHWEPDSGRNGSGALRLDNGTSIIKRGIAVRPMGKYRITGWYRVEGALPDAARLEMKIEWRDQDRDEFRTQKPSVLLPVDRGSEWQQFTMVCTPPRLPGRAGMSLGLSFNLHYAIESSVLFDDVTVTQIVVKK